MSKHFIWKPYISLSADQLCFSIHWRGSSLLLISKPVLWWNEEHLAHWIWLVWGMKNCEKIIHFRAFLAVVGDWNVFNHETGDILLIHSSLFGTWNIVKNYSMLEFSRQLLGVGRPSMMKWGTICRFIWQHPGHEKSGKTISFWRFRGHCWALEHIQWPKAEHPVHSFRLVREVKNWEKLIHATGFKVIVGHLEAFFPVIQ